SGISRGEVAPAWFIAPVHDGDPSSLQARQRRNAAFAFHRPRQWLGLAHQRTKIGVFPFLNATVRQSAGIEATKSFLTQRSDWPPPRHFAERGRERGAQRLLGRRFDRTHVSFH